MIERRRFSRIFYQVPALAQQGQKKLTTCIQDLSLHGLLLWAADEANFKSDQPLEIQFTLPDSDITLSLTAQLVRQNGNNLHLKIQHIDIESISHLKRLVELNVGNDELLHRDMRQLVNLGDQERA